jgi:hypothetical protein
MCIIAVCKRTMTKAEFDNCWDNNDDGFGMAWLEKSEGEFITCVDKGYMTQRSAFSGYMENVEKAKISPHVCHFRLASAGKKVGDLTHPFVISPDAMVDGNDNDSYDYRTTLPVLFHNGHYTDWQNLLVNISMEHGFPKGMISDTKVLCTGLGIAEKKHGVGTYDKLLHYMSGKFVVVVNGNVFMYGEFYDSEDKKVMFSNLTFRSRKTNAMIYENGEWL